MDVIEPKVARRLSGARSARMLPGAVPADPIMRSLSRIGSMVMPGQDSAPSTSMAASASSSSSAILLHELPFDWTLKTKLRLSSTASLDWLTMLPGPGPNRPNHETQFHHALSSHIHPHNLLSDVMSHAQISTISKTSSAFLQTRRSQWEQAFRSLYLYFREDQCDHFYLRSTHFVVLFLACGVPVRNYIAIVTRSSASFRSSLLDNGVQWEMPLKKSPRTSETGERAEEPDVRGQDTLHDGKPESALVIRGRAHLHSFVEVLLNRTYSGDVPRLHAQLSFVNSSQLEIPITFNQVSQKQASSHSSRSLEKSHVIELSGVFDPFSVVQILDVLRRQHPNDVSVRLWTDGLSAPLNHLGESMLQSPAAFHSDTLHVPSCISLADISQPLWNKARFNLLSVIDKVECSVSGIRCSLGSAPTTPDWNGPSMLEI